MALDFVSENQNGREKARESDAVKSDSIGSGLSLEGHP